MRLRVRHELPGRVRLVIDERLGFPGAADQVELAALEIAGVHRATLTVATGTLLVRHDGHEVTRRALLESLERLVLDPSARLHRENSQELTSASRDALLRSAGFALASALLPPPVRALVTLWGALPLVARGARTLRQGVLDSDVLDAVAVGTALGMGDFTSATSIRLLLQLGDYIRLRTEVRARRALAETLERDERQVWVRREGVEVSARAGEVRAGDVVVVRAGHPVPVDGQVVAGSAMVDQSSLTGESLPVARRVGSRVFEGTTVVDGAIDVQALEVGEETRFAKIVRMVEQAEKEKAQVQARADRLADRLVPYVFGMAAITQLATGDPRRAASVLLVDYSCALKLSVPISIRTCQAEALQQGVLVRGGKFVEALAAVDTVVFDKTGTLTEARPRVVDVQTFGGMDEEVLLRETACVEEHFPHPFAAAILQEAKRRGLSHDQELHGEVKYLVSQGIVSLVNGKRFVVGSRRFVASSGIPVELAAHLEEEGRSLVYVGIGDQLAGVVRLEDPVRQEARETVAMLRALGIRRTVLLTGDSAANARRVAAVGIDEWHGELTPEEKGSFVERLKAEGRVVAMLGDGINDAAALSAAQVGVSFQHGADLAKEVADVLILREDLRALPWAIQQARRAMRRIDSNFTLIGTVNTALIGLGIVGLVPPAVSALFHNGTTIAASLRSLRPYMSRPVG